MKKNGLLLIALLLFGMNSIGAPIRRQQARQIAAQFLSGKSIKHRVPSTSEMLTEVVFNKVNAAGGALSVCRSCGKRHGLCDSQR